MTKPRAGTLYGTTAIYRCETCNRHTLLFWDSPPEGVCISCNPQFHPDHKAVTTLPKSAFRVRAEANGQ